MFPRSSENSEPHGLSCRVAEESSVVGSFRTAMFDKLPIELWRIVFDSVDDKLTLWSLSLTSHQIYSLVEPILFNSIDLVSRWTRSYSEVNFPAFYQSLQPPNAHRAALVRHFSIDFSVHEVVLAPALEYLEKILISLHNLRTLRLRHARPRSPIFRRVFLLHGSVRFQLKMLKLHVRATALGEDEFHAFLRSQPQIEHLEVVGTNIDFPAPTDILPRLHILNALPSALPRLLRGRNVERIKTSFMEGYHKHNEDASRVLQTDHANDLAKIRAFSGYLASVTWFKSSFSQLRNVSFLELDTEDEYWDSLCLPPTLSKIECIKLEGEFSFHQLRPFFDQFSSLQCIETEMKPREERLYPRRCYHRWLRDRDEPVVVRWKNGGTIGDLMSPSSSDH